MSLRNLHIGDVAGVPSTLALYQRKLGHKVHVLNRLHTDPLDITTYYKNEVIRTNKFKLALKLILMAKNFDIIHDHSQGKAGRVMNMVSGKPIIIHYHGTDVRTYSPNHRLHYEKHCKKILLATPDLLEWKYSKKPEFIPNPVDLELFHKREFPKNGKGLISLKKGQTKQNVMKELDYVGIDVELEVLDHKNRVDYLEFIKLRENYEYYVDLPFVDDKEIKAHSFTGLQSMAMGQKVIDFEFKIRNELPEQHNPEKIVKTLNKIYEEAMA